MRRRLCVYAETFYDCDGVCLNDADGDGVCNELEIDGCTDASACNYAADCRRRRDVRIRRGLLRL